MSSYQPTILQIVPELDAGGAEKTTIEVAEAIVRAGGRALIVTGGGGQVETARALGATVIVRDVETKNPLKMIGNARFLKDLIAEQGVSLVHARSRAPAWSGEWAARRAGVPFVTTYHGAYTEKGPIKHAYNRVMARGDVVIANSAYTAALVRARYGTPQGRLVVINRGVDVATYDRAAIAEDRVAALRAAWGISQGEAVVLHPARLTRWKGQLVTIAAAGRLDPEHLGPFTVVLAGDAQGRESYVDELRDAIARSGCQGRIHLAGHVSDMAAAYALSDVVVIASTEPEAFGRTSAEAQAVGVPVIATAIGAPRDTVLAPPEAAEHERTGWLVLPGDAAMLAEAITEALTMPPGARGALAARARNNATENYTMRGLQLATLGVYDSLLGTHLERAFSEA